MLKQIADGIQETFHFEKDYYEDEEEDYDDEIKKQMSFYEIKETIDKVSMQTKKFENEIQKNFQNIAKLTDLSLFLEDLTNDQLPDGSLLKNACENINQGVAKYSKYVDSVCMMCKEIEDQDDILKSRNDLNDKLRKLEERFYSNNNGDINDEY